MLKTALANLRAHKARLLLSSVAIVLATAFVAGTFLFTGALRSALTSSYSENLGQADIVVTAGDAEVDQQLLRTVRHADAVTFAHERVVKGPVTLHYPSGPAVAATVVSVASDPTALGWPDLTAGRLPAQPGETVLDRTTAQRSNLSIGETVEVSLDPDSGPAQTQTQTVRIVGLVDPGDSPRYADKSFLGVTTEQAQALPGTVGRDLVLATGAGGVSAAGLVEAVDGAVGSPFQVRTAEEFARDQLSSQGGTTSITAALLAFAAIALVVAAIVIANTFSILLAQRTREMALLRCVGATRRQVFRSVLAESAVLGLLGSVAGVVVGFGLAYGVGSGLQALFDNFPFGAVTPSVTAIVVPLVVGVVVTVAAAVLPARAATRIPPVAALAEQGVPTRRAGRVRLGLAALALLAGAGGLAVGTVALSSTAGLAVVVAGAVAAMLGVLLAAPVLVPPLMRLVGAAARRVLGTPGRLATVNSLRNPRRAAATISALLIGITLISLMSVGAATTRATVTSELNEKFKVDYAIRSQSGMPASVAEALRDLPGLSDVTVTRGTTTQLQGRSGVWVGGYNPQTLAAVTSDMPALTGLDAGEVVLTKDVAHRLGLDKGDTFRLTGSSGNTARLTVSALLPAIGDQKQPGSAYFTQSDLARLFPDAPIAGVFAQAAPGAALAQVGAAIDRVTAGNDVTVVGNAQTHATYLNTLDTVLLVVTALLAIAMLIAVVGIGNTLALSVIERSRESGLLRALGLTRAQLRATLAVEAALLALVGALLGIGLGAVFGWAAITTILGPSFEVVLAVPWPRLAGLTAVAIAAGLLASVLPARRAARASIVSAMADE